ncbi:hypothetical protein K443DRAFT_543256 [Laccaria amethystina LaAM-08-1]|uniref:Uncharacterized protein n=1 Tax=Laccaria amethystina LaAM-08-1 TaxID=1095629 RepID=A0A0C9XAK2_9AGAR|nr:hypothetical protein K443DRAFT_543256 [Laccaria amethystina LaAM-08-1]
MGNKVSSSLQMLSNARNVSISDESTLSAVGGSIYDISIDTVHNLKPAPDVGNFPRTIGRTSDARLRFADTKKKTFWVTIKDLLPRRSILIAGSVVIFIGVAVCLYTGYNPLTSIVGWSKKAITSISQLLASGNTSNKGGNTSNKGSAYGILVEDNSTVQLEGKNEIDIKGFKESYGIAAKHGSKIGMGNRSDTRIRIEGKPVR